MTLVDFVSYEKIKELSALKTRYENQNPYGDDPNKPSLRGLVWSPHLQRVYPEHDLASNVLGSTPSTTVKAELAATELNNTTTACCLELSRMW